MSLTTKSLSQRDREIGCISSAGWKMKTFIIFFYGDPARSPRFIREQIVGYLSKTANSPIPSCAYFIVDSPEGPLGMISLQNISWRNRSCNIDVYMAPEHRKHMTTGINILRTLEYAFDELTLHRVSAIIYAFNQPSWRLLEFIVPT